MSNWTHVNASFRIDSISKITDKEISDVFGEVVSYRDSSEVLDEIFYDSSKKNKYLPMGSEGSLDISIWRNPDENCLASTTVTVFGDLRDYNSFDEIEKWFIRCCESFMIRQAVCQVDAENLGRKIFQYNW